MNQSGPICSFYLVNHDVQHTYQVISYDSHTSNVMAVGFHCDGNWMYSGSEDGTVRIWDLRWGYLTYYCLLFLELQLYFFWPVDSWEFFFSHTLIRLACKQSLAALMQVHNIVHHLDFLLFLNNRNVTHVKGCKISFIYKFKPERHYILGFYAISTKILVCDVCYAF